MTDWWERLSSRDDPGNRGWKAAPTSQKNNQFKNTKFLSRSDWALAASGGALVKPHQNGRVMVINLAALAAGLNSEPQNIEYRISNVEGWDRSRSAGACAACR